MGKKATKATRKFAASGQLKKTIQQRRKHQDLKRKAERRKGSKKGKEKQPVQDVEEEDYIRQWATRVGEAIGYSPTTLHPSPRWTVGSRQHGRSQSLPGGESHRNGSRTNLAVHLLRDAIGGNDIHRASANLTVEMDERWMDDTTILVHRL